MHRLQPLPAPPVVSLRHIPLFVMQDYERCVLPGICGNKARKLASLAVADASEVPSEVVSHGGVQSNAMLALAQLCWHRDRRPFTYHTKPMPRWLRAKPTGNLAGALRLGMQLVEHKSAMAYEAACAHIASAPGFVPQGAAWPGAEEGIKSLAHDICAWRSEMPSGDGWVGATDSVTRHLRRDVAAPLAARPLAVVIPSGTGTTALFVARHVPPDVRVFAVPCVGDADYLRLQWARLEEAVEATTSAARRPNTALSAVPSARTRRPEILEPPSAVPFATPDVSLLAQWRHAAASGVLLDLVYGVPDWIDASNPQTPKIAGTGAPRTLLAPLHMRLLQLVTMSAHVACHPMHDGRPSRGALSRLAIGHPLGLARLPCTSIAVDMVRAPVCGQALAWYLLPRAPRTDAYACSIAKLRVYADRHVAWHARRCAASAEGLATSLRRYERAGLLGTDETADAALQAALVRTSVRLDSARYGESV